MSLEAFSFVAEWLFFCFLIVYFCVSALFTGVQQFVRYPLRIDTLYYWHPVFCFRLGEEFYITLLTDDMDYFHVGDGKNYSSLDLDVWKKYCVLLNNRVQKAYNKYSKSSTGRHILCIVLFLHRYQLLFLICIASFKSLKFLDITLDTPYYAKEVLYFIYNKW